MSAGTELKVDIDAAFEHGVLADTGVVSVGGVEAKQHELAYLPPGSRRLSLEAVSDTRVLLLGGPPFGESIVMWWNFVGRTHEEVVAFRSEWMSQLQGGYADGRFGIPVGNELPPIPAPELPNARLRERR
jgi:redox-sensitive bicupin YhaK (pirin superfamily)